MAERLSSPMGDELHLVATRGVRWRARRGEEAEMTHQERVKHEAQIEEAREQSYWFGFFWGMVFLSAIVFGAWLALR